MRGSFLWVSLICLQAVLAGLITGCGGLGRNTFVSEVLYVADSSAGNILAYGIDNSTGTLTMLAGSPFPGGGGTGVAVDASGKFLFVGSPDGQIIDVYSISSGTGALVKLTDPNSDSRQPGQTGAGDKFGLLGIFAGSLAVIPSRQLLYVTNPNEGGVYAFSIGSSGTLMPLLGSPFNVPLTNPVGLTADPSGKFLYTGNIWDGSVLESTIDPVTGALKQPRARRLSCWFSSTSASTTTARSQDDVASGAIFGKIWTRTNNIDDSGAKTHRLCFSVTPRV